MTPTLDKYDKQILELLQQNGRISNQELAEAINLSPSPTLRRVKLLEEAGLIEAYVALLDAKKLGLTLMAFIGISMDKHTPERFDALETTLASYPEVLECHLITGQSADYLLKVIVKDMEAYQNFLLNKLTRIDGVSGVHTSFVMKSAIRGTALPVE
jgi:Lrp/AsnC family leucine-responsive transcriptional regulator